MTSPRPIPTRRALSSVAAVLLWPASISGCSWYVVKGPPDSPSKGADVPCTDGYELPALDTAFVALSLLLVSSGVYGLGRGDGSGAIPLLIGLGGAGVAGWSAYGGYRNVTRCREAKARQNAGAPGR